MTRASTPAQVPSAPEIFFHVQLNDILEAFLMPGWRYTHIPSGEYRPKPIAAKLQRMGVQPGWPDFILLSGIGTPHFLELKRRRAGRLSVAQEDFAQWCEQRRVPFVVCHSLETAVAKLTEWRALKRQIIV